MMPHWLSVMAQLAVGAVLLAVAHRSYRTGELRAGTNFFRGAYRPNREDNPLAMRCKRQAESPSRCRQFPVSARKQEVM